MEFWIAMALVAAFSYSIWVAVLVWRADFYSSSQKAAQVGIALLIPLLGAILVHGLLRSHAAEKHQDEKFVANRDDHTATGPHVRMGDDA